MTIEAKTCKPEHAADHPSRQPYIENYPPLKAWINRHEDTICQWQKRIGAKMMVERWIVDGVPVIIEIYGDGHGWNIYTTSPDNTIVHAVADAEDRIEAWKYAAKVSDSAKE